jgi:hypothetical protein
VAGRIFNSKIGRQGFLNKKPVLGIARIFKTFLYFYPEEDF